VAITISLTLTYAVLTLGKPLAHNGRNFTKYENYGVTMIKEFVLGQEHSQGVVRGDGSDREIGSLPAPA
jgi:hypothetical protein